MTSMPQATSSPMRNTRLLRAKRSCSLVAKELKREMRFTPLNTALIRGTGYEKRGVGNGHSNDGTGDRRLATGDGSCLESLAGLGGIACRQPPVTCLVVQSRFARRPLPIPKSRSLERVGDRLVARVLEIGLA